MLFWPEGSTKNGISTIERAAADVKDLDKSLLRSFQTHIVHLGYPDFGLAPVGIDLHCRTVPFLEMREQHRMALQDTPYGLRHIFGRKRGGKRHDFRVIVAKTLRFDDTVDINPLLGASDRGSL